MIDSWFDASLPQGSTQGTAVVTFIGAHSFGSAPTCPDKNGIAGGNSRSHIVDIRLGRNSSQRQTVSVNQQALF